MQWYYIADGRAHGPVSSSRLLALADGAIVRPGTRIWRQGMAGWQPFKTSETVQVPPRTCSRCHGSHGAAPPGTGDINKICGQCHGHTRDAFRQSPHWRTMAAEGWGDCTACHDNHRVERPTSQMWISTCKPCHDSDSEAVRTGEKILVVLTQAEEAIEKGHQAIDRARAVPLEVIDYEARLNTASAYLVETRPLGHSLNVANIEEGARKARSVAQEVQAAVHEQLDVLEGRNLIVVFVWIYILITIVAIQYYKHSTR